MEAGHIMALVLLALVFAIVGAFILARPKLSDLDIDKINIGDTKDQVRAVFGKPGGVTKPGHGDDAETWVYTIPMRLYVSIGFDRKGVVRNKYRNGEI
jgi:outer membrane protein assembly factor BamE (lipoprotein component of BamABCDE complex)